MIPYILLSIFLVLLIVTIVNFNKLSKGKNQIENSISSLDASFIKRSDLIPNLIETVKKYMSFESDTLEKITSLRGATSTTNQEVEKAGNNALKNLMIQVENYPELKANTQFTNLQYSWNEIEDEISAGRRYISASITAYNNGLTTFPGNVIGSITGFKKHEWQYASKEQQKNVNASELF